MIWKGYCQSDLFRIAAKLRDNGLSQHEVSTGSAY